MNGWFDSNGKIYQIMQLCSDLLVLTIIMILSSIPLITIGAALTAGYTVAFGIIEQKGQSISREYFKSFKKNFWNATKIWCSYLVVIFLLIVSIPFVSKFSWIQYPMLLLFTIFMMTCMIVFPLLSRFENNAFITLKNSFFLVLQYVPSAILIFGVWFLYFIGGIFVHKLFLVWLFWGLGTCIVANSWLFQQIIKRYELNEKR